MMGIELKGIIVILIIISIILNFMAYKEVYVNKRSFLFGIITIDEGFRISKSFWILFFISISLFTYGLYLNDCPPIILF